MRNIVNKNNVRKSVRRSLNFIEGSNITLTIDDNAVDNRTDITIESTGGGGVSDGLKGDINVSGTSWTIVDNAVTNDKISDVDASKVVQNELNRFVTDDEKSTWYSKADESHNHAISDITDLQSKLDAKEEKITNGFGITGTSTKSVSLTTAEAFCTAETTLTSASYADITGASISLTAGTWLILATINAASQSTTATVINAAITDDSNNVLAQGAQHIVAGTATVRTWGNVTLSLIVSHTVTTTYKLRGARGNTTHTGNCIVSDGTGQGTANNNTNNSDKSTSIRAIRIA